MREAFKASALAEAIQEIVTRPEVLALLEDLCRLHIRSVSGSPSIIDKQLDWEFRSKRRKFAKYLNCLWQASSTSGEVDIQSHVNKTTKQYKVPLKEIICTAMAVVNEAVSESIKITNDAERKQRECEQKQNDKRKHQEFIKQQNEILELSLFDT